MAPVRDGRALFFFPVVSLLSSQYNVSEHSDPGCVRAGGAFFSPRRLSFEVQHKRCRDPDDACKTQKVFFPARITTLGTSRRHRAGKWMQLSHKPGPPVWRLLLHLESRPQLPPGMGLTEVKGVFSLLFFFTTSTALPRSRDVHEGVAPAEARRPPTLTNATGRAPRKLLTAPGWKNHEETPNRRFPLGRRLQHRLTTTLAPTHVD